MTVGKSFKPERNYQGQSAANRRAERRERLLQAALEVYGGSGYRQATVKAVCDAAGLTQRYFYEEFDSQEALLCAAYSRAMGEVRETLLASWDAGKPLAERVEATTTAYFGHLHSHPEAARIFLLEMEGVSERVNAVAAQELGATTQLLREHLLGSIEVRGLDPDLLALGIMGAICQMAKAWWTQPQPPSVEKMARHAGIICLGITGHLQDSAGHPETAQR